MEKVIITGADGFVGSYTAHKFALEGCNVLALDIAKEPKRIRPDKNIVYRQCDISNIEQIQGIIKSDLYDIMIHFAWAGSAGFSRVDYDLQIRNVHNTVECMKAAKKFGCKRFVCAGSIMEYEVEAAVHTQGSHPSMGYIYGAGKHTAHCVCKSVAAEIGIELVWSMITNAYGVGELSPRFVNTTLRKVINGEPLQFTAATQNYDFIYITDVADAFYLIAKNGKPFCEYMVGSSNARPLKEFILEMLHSVAPNVIPMFGDVPFTGTNIPLSVFDTSATQNDTGFQAKISFAEGTRMTMEWLKTL